MHTPIKNLTSKTWKPCLNLASSTEKQNSHKNSTFGKIKLFAPIKRLPSETKPIAQLDHLRPGVALTGELLGERRAGHLVKTGINRFASDVFPRDSFAPADRAVDRIAPHEHVVAIVTDVGSMRERPLER